MKCLRIVTPVLFGIVSIGCAGRVSAQVTYSFATINVPGAFQTSVEGINNSGQMAGLADQAFFYSDGNFARFNYPGGTQTDAHGINNLGQVVGEYVSAGVFHGFLKIGDSFTAIDYPGAADTYAYGINDIGQIVGDFYDGSKYHGFLYSGGSFTAIDHPGASCISNACGTFATGINNKGQIVGYFGGNDAIAHGFLYSGGTFTTVDDPDVSCPPGLVACGAFPLKINNQGQIVGYFVVGVPVGDGAIENDHHGFLYTDGSFTTINDPNNPVNTLANAINDKGLIAGDFLGAPSGGPGTQGFLATPVPSLPFATFKPRLRLDVDRGAFDLEARFAPGEGGHIEPLTDAVTFGIGPYSVTIPAGSFKRQGKDYRFKGVIAGVHLDVSILHRCRQRGDEGNSDRSKNPNCHACEGNEAPYVLTAGGKGANLTGITNPVAVSLSIGNNSGSAEIMAEFY